VTKRYLEALSRFDDAAMAELSDWTPAERDRARAFRAFERGSHTRWRWRIVGVEGDLVYVFETKDKAPATGCRGSSAGKPAGAPSLPRDGAPTLP
jgi:hypothetical protein